jgi:hypothetical protein
VINNPLEIINDYHISLNSVGQKCGKIEHELQVAPHLSHQLPKGKCAIYVFSLSCFYKIPCSSGVNRVLKVGKVGPNCNSRFQYQHYGTEHAPSTLSKQIINSQILWIYLGIKGLFSDTVVIG